MQLISGEQASRIYRVSTPQRTYPVLVERECLVKIAEFISPDGTKPGKIFVVTTRDVWELHGAKVRAALDARVFQTLFFAGAEENKRLEHVERLAVQMSEGGADRSSVVVAFGGGIVTDLGGFLASIFMRGIPVVQVPTTLLAQVDAAVGGKTGTNLVTGKNLIGTFHQPLAVLIDPSVLATLPEREYRAGLYEIVKTGVIASEPLFRLLAERRGDVLAQNPQVVDRIVAESVRIKAEVVSSDERENGLRKILNFGHTFGHALEAETSYKTFLHGEAVSWGMRAATYLALDLGMLKSPEFSEIIGILDVYGPIPSTGAISAQALQARLVKDKKTIQGRIHFVLPVRIGEVAVRADIAPGPVAAAIECALADCR